MTSEVMHLGHDLGWWINAEKDDIGEVFNSLSREVQTAIALKHSSNLFVWRHSLIGEIWGKEGDLAITRYLIS